jgi:hypothetical protein
VARSRFLRRNFNAANKWLSAINTAALERKIPVQIWCDTNAACLRCFLSSP